ncbi:hypothetical protein PG989_012337 [Apiospora arundinis]
MSRNSSPRATPTDLIATADKEAVDAQYTAETLGLLRRQTETIEAILAFVRINQVLTPGSTGIGLLSLLLSFDVIWLSIVLPL